MKLSAIALTAALTAALALPGTAAAQGYEAPKADIVETAVAAGSFNTLAAAIEAAGLVETLKGEGPFTVFAPTDEAFARLPAGALDGLLADREKLAQVLTYHVVPGRVSSAGVAAMQSAKTVNGKKLRIEAEDGKATVGGATVTQADIAASNGVIHVIDTVLLPE